ncbi:NTP transferase domain-containing protein [Ruminococcaceae bacterium OttesenSCG-928-L11]|nr:NTP transferase domain-containing protein [Ruminococcaceae bacterium OttesenSCG-928-L11]
MKAIVLAAGKGKRIAGGAHDMPKVMREANGRPLLSYVLDNIGFIPRKDTAIVVGYKGEMVRDYFGDEYQYPLQAEQLGTGHAVKAARPAVGTDDDNVLVCYGDMPLFSRATYEGVIHAHRQSGSDCTMLTAVVPNPWLHYGRVIRDDAGKFLDVVEHRDCTPEQLEIDELNVGMYVFRAKALFDTLDKLTTDNVQGEYYLTDVPRLLTAQGNTVDTFTIYNANEIYGVNTPDELELCEEILARLEQAGIEKRQNRWFGTGGWRSIIGEDFTKANVRILAQAMADDMKSKGKDAIVIGHDRRFLSDKAAVWAAEVFAGNGITVHYISRIAPTPLVMFTVKTTGVYYGMAVTASHNPADYNGIKVFTQGGRDADVETTDVFESIIAQGVTPTSVDFDRGMREGTIQIVDPNNDYIDSIISLIDMQAIRRGNLRVVLDPMFGVSKTTLQTILMTARCDVDIINDRHDTLFGGRLPSPTAVTLSKLRDMVVEQQYDLGIGTDGDADRIGIIDNTGRYIHPNEILVLLYYYLLRYKGQTGDCVRNIATTHILDKIAADFGCHCHEVPVGFKHISSKMEETGAIIGGESSGGLTIEGHIKGKDGIFASALIVEMLCVTGKRISQLLEEIAAQYGSAVMLEYDTRFSREKKDELQTLLFRDKQLPDFGIPVETVSYLDGCKVYFAGGGWIIARFSGTEPLIRIFCEMPTEAEAKDIQHRMCAFLGL